MKTALVQMKSGLDQNENFRKAEYFIQKAVRVKATFILLPEVFSFRGKLPNKKELGSAVQRLPNKYFQHIQGIAAQNKLYILAGSFLEEIPGSQKIYNTSVLIGPDGKIIQKYRKMHLFEAHIDSRIIRESDSFKKGNKPVMARVGDYSVGLSICYDLRFSWLYQYYAALGADILTVPSAFTKTTGQAHWEVLLRARAIENLCYVLAPNQVGIDNRNIATFGHSMIIDPWGKVLTQASASREEIICADIDRETLRQARARLPQTQRRKIYGK